MKPFTKKLLLVSSALLCALPESASALAMFSSQTGKSCMACHTQNMPKLNSYGKEFALSGYTIYDESKTAKPLIVGSDVPLGLPSTLSVSAVLKASYVKTTQEEDATTGDLVGTERGELQGLSASGIYFGGRVADNFGALVSLKGNDDKRTDIVYNAKLLLAYSAMGGYAGMSLISTETNGLFSGMELHNTGLNTPVKMFENAYATNAAQATGVGNGPATALQAYYGNANLFVSAGIGIPAQNSEGLDAGKSLLPFYRISYSQPIGDWNFMVGAYAVKGDVEASDMSLNGELVSNRAELVKIHKEAHGFDFEMSGKLFDMSAMATVNHVVRNTVDVDPAAVLTAYNLQSTDNKGTSVELQINPIEPLGLKVGYLSYANNDDAATNQKFIKNYDYEAYTVGASYNVLENFSVGIDVSRYYPESDIKSYDDIYVNAALAF
ncbi:hypothetical protein KJ870_09610 [bacterium]|nr:hypothetical protein [bacterium]MBU1435182.1 hypothetical protein [bacterium]MBU1502839.1 hypothetical protein [bacterium]